MKHHRTTRNLLGAALAVVVALGLGATATPASASPIDQPLISAGGTDFGANLVNGVPLNGGVLDWHQVAGQPTDPQLNGTLYLQHPAGVDAHVELEYYNANHTLLGTRIGGTKTSTNAATDRFNINLGGFANSAIVHMHIEVHDDSTGVMALRGLDIEDL